MVGLIVPIGIGVAGRVVGFFVERGHSGIILIGLQVSEAFGKQNMNKH